MEGLSYQPPGSAVPLLQNVSMHLEQNCLGIIFGRSGAGKSTLLQVLAGLLEHSEGTISFNGGFLESSPKLPQLPATTRKSATAPPVIGLTAQQRMNRAGLVFQFPERHFVGSTLADELTAGWPVDLSPAATMARQTLTTRTYQVITAVGLDGLPLDTPLTQLSGGYKRRAALAVQLIRRPELMLLDEPLAGLDWRARGDVVQLLAELKKECTVLIVSHDLKELSPLCDASWRMRRRGMLVREALPISAMKT